MIVKFRNFW